MVILRTYFSNKVTEFGEQTLIGHVLGKQTSHVCQESTSCVNIADHAMVALRVDNNEDAIADGRPDRIHK